MTELRRSLDEQSQRSLALQQELDSVRTELDTVRTRLHDVDLERRIAYYRAEYFLRMHAYISREPSIHRVRPCIPIYPWPHDSGIEVDRLGTAALSYLGDCDSCSVCLLAFDSSGWYTLACLHRFHLACIITAMCTRRQCPICRADIPVALYMLWGIDDLLPAGPDQTVDLISRLPLGEEDRDRQAIRDTLVQEGYRDTEIAALIGSQPGTVATVRDHISADTHRAQWDTLIEESLQRHQRGPIPRESDFVDPILEEALRAAEADTREGFRARVYADTRIWEMGHGARRTAADQELAYARVRFLESQRASSRGDITRGAQGAESSRTAEDRFISEEARAAEQVFGGAPQVPVVPTQRTIAERVIQVPRPRTQRSSYYEGGSDSD